MTILALSIISTVTHGAAIKPLDASTAVFTGSPISACLFLSSPGDVHLNNSHLGPKGEGSVKYHFTDPLGVGGMIVDALNLRNPIQKFDHSSVVTNIELYSRDWALDGWFNGTTIERKSTRDERYSSTFRVVRVKGGISINEQAVTNARNLSLTRLNSYCSNNVDEVFEGRFSGPPNMGKKVGPIQAVLSKVHHTINPIARFMDSLTTPSSLASSPEVDKVCEIADGKLAYPQSIPTSEIVKWAEESARSGVNQIQRHGRAVLEWLREGKAIDESHRVLLPKLRFAE